MSKPTKIHSENLTSSAISQNERGPRPTQSFQPNMTVDAISNAAKVQGAPYQPDEDSAVKQVINSISGGACFGWLAAAAMGVSSTETYVWTALGVMLALAITVWVWNK
jgi:hypothetical protein